MNSTNPREREVFLAALDRPPDERAEFLSVSCGADADLRARVDALLAEQQQMGSFLETPAIAGPSRPRISPGGTVVLATGLVEVNEKPGARIGRYKLLQNIGEGGCGVVYMAEQEEPVRRRVALKVIKLGMDTRSIIARFEAERQALALMEHPNIARVFDAGATETGRPYFVMELVRGVRITDFCDENNLDTRARLALFAQVCLAIQHAHQKGIIHRDIKPSNILVTLHDGVPVPKVIDFGIAKATDQRLTDKTLFTEFQSFIGTPAYTSPEQAEMSGLDIDTRTDLYSLGVLLYELLTGQTPFDPERLLQSGLHEMRRIIREEEPQRPSTRLGTLGMSEATVLTRARRIRLPELARAVRGDLDWIVMKCLEKDRTRRYATANDLAQDVQRYLDNEPVLARPPSTVYRFQKLLRKHRTAFAAAAGVAAALVIGAGISLWQAWRATLAEQDAVAARMQESQLRQEAEAERERALRGESAARLNEYVADINLAQLALKDGNLGRAVQLLEKHRPPPGQPDLRGFEWRYLWQLCSGDPHEPLPKQDGPVESVALSPDGKLLALAVRDHVKLLNAATGSLIARFPPDSQMPRGRGGGPRSDRGFLFLGGMGGLGFLGDGSLLATSIGARVQLWKTSDGSLVRTLPDATGPIEASPDGRLLAVTRGSGPVPFWEARDEPFEVAVLDAGSWSEVRKLPGAEGPIAFSSDGSMVAADTSQGIAVWNLMSDDAPMILQNSTNVMNRGGMRAFLRYAMAFSPDGAYLAAARNTVSERGVFVVSIWDLRTGLESAVIPANPGVIEHTSVISCVAFSPDGRTLATGSFDYSIRLWDFATREKIATLQGHLGEIWSLEFSKEGSKILSSAKDGSVKFWPAQARTLESRESPGGIAIPLAMTRDSRTLAAFAWTNAVVFLDLPSLAPLRQFQLERTRHRIPLVAVSEDLRLLVQGLDDGSVKLWNTLSNEAETLKVSDRPLETIALSPDGRRLLTRGRDQMSRLWDLKAGTNSLVPVEGWRMVFSPDGTLLAALDPRARSLQLWDIPAQGLRTNVDLELQPAYGAVFSPDGRQLAVICADDTIRLLSTGDGRFLGTFSGHKQPVFSVAFTPDGKTLASASDDSTLKLWNVASGQELLSDRRLGGAMSGLLFSSDGGFLIAGSSPFERTPGLRLFRAPTLEEIDRARVESRSLDPPSAATALPAVNPATSVSAKDSNLPPGGPP